MIDFSKVICRKDFLDRMFSWLGENPDKYIYDWLHDEEEIKFVNDVLNQEIMEKAMK